jgi:cobalt/nickel transport system permease protein
MHYHGHSVVHRLPAHVKVVALVGFLIAVVATPRGAWAAYAALSGVVLTAVAATQVPLGYLARRMVVELPFVLFALLLPFVATGPRVDVLGIPLSPDGAVGAGTLLAKATLGTVASLILASTTEARDLVAGLERLRLPAQLVAILGFMVRYVDVVADQVNRMRMARAARAFSARSLRDWPVLAHSSGALFIRSYERGERVHLAMLSRGFTGSLPYADEPSTTARSWAQALSLPLVAGVVCTVAVLSR